MKRGPLTIFLPLLLLSVLILPAVFSLGGSGREIPGIGQKAEALDIPAAQEHASPTVPAAPQVRENMLVITAVGDIMMHDMQINAGYRSRNKYDFFAFFARVKPLLDASDLVVGNLETPMAGKDAGYSGYPYFNAPEALAANLKDAGFDMLTTANNHALDQGRQGLKSTLNFLDQAGLLHTGTARSPEEQQKIMITETKGVKLAFLAYTYGTNGVALAKNYRYSVNYIDEDAIKKDIGRARELGAQLVIVSLHFGQEYETAPDAEQESLVRSLLASGADIILGHHSHVLQPVFWQKGVLPAPSRFAAYSLGNFISAQEGLERNTSILLNLYIGIDDAGKARLRKAGYIPIATRRFKENGATRFEVLPVEPALTSLQLGRNGGISAALNNDDYIFLRAAWDLTAARLQYGSFSFGPLRLPLPLDGLSHITSLVQE